MSAIRHLFTLAAALMIHAAVPAAAQINDASRMVTTLGSSEVSSGTWQRLGDDRSQRDERHPSPLTDVRSLSLLRDVAGDYARFFTTWENYLILELGLMGSVGLKALDEPIRGSSFNSALWFNRGTAVDHAFEPGKIIGGTLVQVGGPIATYGIGIWIGNPGVAELGRDLVRVQLLNLTGGLTQLLKRTVARARPDGGKSRPNGGHQGSFPSGHTSVTFASATVLQRHYGWKAGIPAFGVASYVAASRLSENQHFLSDVVFGAVIGIAAGRTVMFGRGSTRFEVSPMAAPGGAGVQVSLCSRGCP